jgi:hypothetical protein
MSVNQMATSVARVAHKIFTPTYAIGKNQFIVELVLPIWSILLGLPGFLAVFTYVAGLDTSQSRFYFFLQVLHLDR